MHVRADVAAAMTAVLIAAPLTPAAPPVPTPARSGEIRLTATVPPGGLITSIVRNQGIYCSIICPLLAQTGVVAVSTTLQSPGAFLAALPREGLLKAIGAAAASVTGPTAAAMERAIAADAAIPAQRALNAFEVGVVGLLDIAAALRGGPAAVLAAIGRARQQTFDALNAPVIPNPSPTVAPHGLVQVAVVQVINIVGAVIFPAFNEVLAGVFEVPNAMAQRLAATGDPAAALVAGVATAVGVVKGAAAVIGDAVVAAIRAVRAAGAPSPTGHFESASFASRSAAPSAGRSITPPARAWSQKSGRGPAMHRRSTHDTGPSLQKVGKHPSSMHGKVHRTRPARPAGHSGR